jgi:hypothetical protein
MVVLPSAEPPDAMSGSSKRRATPRAASVTAACAMHDMIESEALGSYATNPLTGCTVPLSGNTVAASALSLTRR